MNTIDFYDVAVDPYYDFVVKVPLSKYKVSYDDYLRAYHEGFRTAHRHWEGLDNVTILEEAADRLVRRLSFGTTPITDCIEGSGERFTHWILDAEGKVYGRNDITIVREGDDACVRYVCSLVPVAKQFDPKIEAIRKDAYRSKDEAFALGVLADLLEAR